MVAKLLLFCAAMVALPAAAIARDREPELLAHRGKWQVDYDEEACHLIGEFGAGDGEVIVRFTRYQPGDYSDLTLYGKRMRGLTPVVDVQLGFGPGRESGRREAMTGTAGNVPLLMINSVRLDAWRAAR